MARRKLHRMWGAKVMHADESIEMGTCLVLGKQTLRVVGSSVANSLSSATTVAAVRLFRSVLLPAFV